MDIPELPAPRSKISPSERAAKDIAKVGCWCLHAFLMCDESNATLVVLSCFVQHKLAMAAAAGGKKKKK